MSHTSRLDSIDVRVAAQVRRFGLGIYLLRNVAPNDDRNERHNVVCRAHKRTRRLYYQWKLFRIYSVPTSVGCPTSPSSARLRFVHARDEHRANACGSCNRCTCRTPPNELLSRVTLTRLTRRHLRFADTFGRVYVSTSRPQRRFRFPSRPRGNPLNQAAFGITT